jgi:CheY-like chemotaxis protein
MEAGIQQNSINSDWADELVEAFSPYPQFVTAVTEGLSGLMEAQNITLAEIDSANARIATLQEQIEALNRRAENSEARLASELARASTAPENRIQVQDQQLSLVQDDSRLLELKAEHSRVQAELEDACKLISTLRAEVHTAQAEARLPVSRESTRGAKAPSKNLTEKKILVIDDAELSRVLLSRSFRGLPVKLEFAKSLDRASELCTGTDFDWMLIDYALATGASGSALGELQGKVASGSRIAALSSKEASQDEAASAREAGFGFYFSRTLERNAFRESLVNSIWG